jgi:Mrp family chromosome partitioning ATPase
MSAQSELHAINHSALMEASLSALTSESARIEIEPDRRSRLVFVTDPCGLAVERYKLLRRRLCAANPQGGLLLITSPAPGDGKTLTSINLAHCLAEAGHPTCIVDLDFRSPGVTAQLGYEPDGFDVADVLQGNATIAQAVRKISEHPLYLLNIKEGRDATSPFLDTAVMRPFLFRLRGAFTWVILDLPPAIPFSDVSEVLPEVDGALMIVRSGKTKRSLIGPTMEVLSNKLWGVVLNDAEIKGGDYYGYYRYGGKGNRKGKPRRDDR